MKFVLPNSIDQKNNWNSYFQTTKLLNYRVYWTVGGEDPIWIHL